MSAAGNVSPRLPLEGATEPHPDGLRIALGSGGVFYLYPPAKRTQADADAEAVRIRRIVAKAAVAAAANIVDEVLKTEANAAETIGEWSAAKAAATAAAGAAALRTALEPPALRAAEEACVQTVRVYLQGYLEGAALEGAAAAREAAEAEEAAKPKKRGRPRRRPEVVPQQTWPEFEAVVFGVVRDGKAADAKGALWIETPGEVALAHEAPGSGLSLKLGASTIDDPLKDYAPLVATSYEDLRGLLATHAGQRTAYLFNYTVARASEKPGAVTVSVDELVDVSGPRPHTEAEHVQRRREAWGALRLFAHIAVHGRRASYANAGEILRTAGPLFAFTERADEGQLSLDGSEPPREVTYVAGPWLERLAASDLDLLPYFGDVLALARQSDRQPRYIWQKAIAWALGQRVRQGAVNAAKKRQGTGADGKEKPSKLQTRNLTRRELLDYLNPEPHYADILKSNDPRRAVKYWDDAVSLLRQLDADGNEGVIGAAGGDYVEHGPAPWRKPKTWPKGKAFKPQGWGDAWLDEPLTIRPGPAGQAALQDVKASADKTRPKRKKRAAN